MEVGCMSIGKHCLVAYATRERQYLWRIEVPENASVQEVLAAARGLAADAAVPWDEASTGIFGEPCARTDVPRDGDRIELYRPLAQDPKQARRERVRRLRRGARG
jgi:uncharacterized protein